LTVPSIVTIIRRLTPMLLPRPILVPTALIGGAFAAWIVTYQRMHGMDAGPGTDLGGLGWYLGIWVTMTTAMMLPSAMPTVVAFNRVSAERARRETAPALPGWAFVAGYLVAWTAYGVAAYGLYRAAKNAAPHFFTWSSGGQYVAAGALLLAGLYELAPLKDACLRRCRTPLHLVVHGWRNGPVAPLRLGLEHGLYCVGCCFGLMLALFAVGVMSLVWMALVAAVIFAEKVLPSGYRLAPFIGAAFVALAIGVTIAPSWVPGLHVP
jgi:predicted metal-binding membrane protein